LQKITYQKEFSIIKLTDIVSEMAATIKSGILLKDINRMWTIVWDFNVKTHEFKLKVAVNDIEFIDGALQKFYYKATWNSKSY